MEIEAIGIVTIALGLLGWFTGRAFSIQVLFTSTLLSSAAALVLPSLGYANIQPAHLMLGFLAPRVLSSRATGHRLGRVFGVAHGGFWLLLTALYAILSALFLPRIFAGATWIFAVSRIPGALGIIAQPLQPVTGNITQPAYFVGDLICFLIFYVAASRPDGLTATVNAALVAVAANLAFAAIDLGSYWAGYGDVLGFIRNADYSMLDEGVVIGFKRIVGSFPEASTFAYFTLGFFAFALRLWVGGLRPRVTAPLALLSFIALVFSTSSTGYVAAAAFLLVFFGVSLIEVLRRPVSRGRLVLVALLPLVASVTLIGLRLNQPAWRAASEMVDQAVIHKLDSSSGIERQKWNDEALLNLSDTDGFGAGAGSVRASSFPIAVLGNIGVFGALTYSIFLVDLFFSFGPRWQAPFPALCQSAARWACFAQLLGASVSGGSIDLGLPFFIFAGLACSAPETSRVEQRPPTAASSALASAAGRS